MTAPPIGSISLNESLRVLFSRNNQCRSLLLLIFIAIISLSNSHAQTSSTRLVSGSRKNVTHLSLQSSVWRTNKVASAIAQSAVTLTATLPSGTVGTPYFGSVSAVGGVSPYTFSVTAGALPSGLSLDQSSGTISGTPTVVVSKTFWVRVSDANGATTRLHTQITISSSPSAAVVTPLSVAVSPVTASVGSGSGQQFSATVQGTSNTAVSWSASSGTISSTGFFTAPTVTSSTNVTVSATSAADSTQASSALVTVIPPATPVSVTVSPSSVSVTSGGTQQFTALVQGTTNTAVTWTAGAGTISSSGFFTAPAVTSNTSVSIAAFSAADPSATSSTNVTVVAPAPGPSPTPATPSTGALCGTDSNGVPTGNSQCGARGTSPYSGDNATDLSSWCGGSVPGSCVAITTCNQSLISGTYSDHAKYYLAGDLNCGGSSLALKLSRYADINLNGFTITGAVFSNMGVKGWHLFNGTINCSVQYGSQIASGFYAYGCIQDSNNGGTYTPGGGDQIRIHHISGQNSYGCSKFIQLDGNIPAPAGGWTEPAIVAYNNTFQSVPVTTSCMREYAGVYSETEPVEYYNNQGNVGATGASNATQLLVVYGPGSNGDFPNSIHNNYLSCSTFNVNNAMATGDTCRPVLCDGALSCHVQYNDIWATNNRGVRLRDALNAEVDHNYFHGLLTANSYTGVAVHTGDNDVNSSFGQNLNQNIHDNTIELGAGAYGIFLRDQVGVLMANNTYLCAQAGCSNAKIVNIGNLPLMGGTAIDQITKVLTCSGCDFYNGGRAYKTGSSIRLSGWSNNGNNGTFVVAVGPSSSNTKQMVLADPNNVLISESGSATAGAYPATELIVQSASFNANLVPEALTMPQTTLQECSSLGISVLGGGTVLTSCN